MFHSPPHMMGVYFPHLKILYLSQESTVAKYPMKNWVNKTTNSHHPPKKPLSHENLKPGLTNAKSRASIWEKTQRIQGRSWEMSPILTLIVIINNCYKAHVVFKECNNKISAPCNWNQILHLIREDFPWRLCCLHGK